jgi:hypothetical protein
VHNGQVEPRYASVVELYDPINTLKPVGEDLWVVDGPIVRMVFLGAFGTVPDPHGRRQARERRPLPMVLHRARRRVAQRDRRTGSGAPPGLTKQAPLRARVRLEAGIPRGHGVGLAGGKGAGRFRRGAEEVCFGRDLSDGPEEAWRRNLDQLIFRGSRFMEEMVFFHRKTRTLILADFIENFEPEKVGSLYVWLLRLAGVEDPDGKTPPKSG